MRNDGIQPYDFQTIFAQYANQVTFASLPEWYVVGGHCTRCKRNGWIDRRELLRRYGDKARVMTLSPALRCRKCSNKGTNQWIAAKLPR